ncbi:TPA: flagellin FliC [Enterobacter asburiae]|jgi:flagellin|uniref:flagellin N-terminal helical domain-containing protein n=1 Tax=Enterobacter TaxID=547 RepID=UPI00063CEF6A|nr:MULTISPECIES: flagellin [Enterobacter]EHN8920319.1 flagellin FliC [Enterobacter asburiae]EKS7201512.1 flagellin FliC [Enterobacter asburiae]ELH8610799.1 flagellin FliC [Enterobacter asburiae]ELQ7874181.1 flagellin FliC [Enterobacter asburiae]KLF90230.1 flagellin [Enterobacter asburiae]
MAVINTNLMSLTTQNNLNKSQSSLGTAIERLSSGLRINSAKDDAAGQAIANRMTSQIKGMTQAARNANDGISMAQTAEGSLNEINNNLQRVRELAVQASNGTNSTSDLASLQDEVTARLAEINRVAGKTDFNGIKLLDGTAGTAGKVKIQVGVNDGDTIDLDLSGAKADTTTLGVNAIDLKAMTATDLDTIDKAIAKVDTARSGLGAVQNRFTSAINNLNNTSNNLSAAQSRIQDADYATEVSNMSRAQILQQAGTSVLSQANQVPQTVLSLLR